MKYKVGDKVKVKEWHTLVGEFGTDENGDIDIYFAFVPPMRRFCGQVVTISDVWDEGCYNIKEDPKKWNFQECVFEEERG